MTFDCPKCGAPVNYESASDAFGGAATARCGYCNSSSIVPDELRGRQAQISDLIEGVHRGGFTGTVVLGKDLGRY